MNPILYGLVVTLFGMLIVFLVLALLWATLRMLKVVFGEKQKNSNIKAVNIELKPAAAEVASTNAVAEEMDADELVAVITAAISVCMASQSNLFIRKITRTGDISPIWNQVGRHEQTLNRL